MGGFEVGWSALADEGTPVGLWWAFVVVSLCCENCSDNEGWVFNIALCVLRDGGWRMEE